MRFRLRSIASALLGLSVLLPFGASLKADEAETQVAAVPIHRVTLDAELNGDRGFARDVVFKIQGIGSEAPPAQTLQGPGDLDLPAGRYKVVATLSQISIVDQIDVAAPMTYTAELFGGGASLALITKIGGKPVKDDIVWRVLTWRKDSQGQRKLVVELTGPQQDLILPEGWYLVEANRNGKITKHTIEVNTGRSYKYTILEQ